MIGLKKLVVIICILLAIFIGMYINQRNQISSAKITAEEVDNIEVYDNQYIYVERSDRRSFAQISRYK